MFGPSFAEEQLPSIYNDQELLTWIADGLAITSPCKDLPSDTYGISGDNIDSPTLPITRSALQVIKTSFTKATRTQGLPTPNTNP